MNIRRMNRDKAFQPLIEYVDNLISQVDKLRDKLDSYDKDEHVAKLIEENKNLRINSLHTLTEKEKEQVEVFKLLHWEGCRGNTRYILEGTGIGTAVSLQCTRCKHTKNITDMENW